MHRGVYAVKAMRKHSYRGHSMLDGSPMGTDINAIGQTTDDKHIGALGGKVTHETLTEVAPIVGTLTRTYNTYHTARVK